MNKHFVLPKVFFIGATGIDLAALTAYLRYTDQDEFSLAMIEANKEGLIGAFTIWMDIYNLKMNVVEQLNKAAEASPVKGYLQDGTQTQEGFVSNGLKFVDRMGFSRQNLAGRA
jgi:predicted ATPase